MLDRRTFLLSTAAGFALAGSRGALAQEAATGPAAELNALMDRALNDMLDSGPEFATMLGLDSGERATARTRLNDRSIEGIRARHERDKQGYAALRRIDRSALTGLDAVNYDTLNHYMETVVPTYDRFAYGTHSWPEPYTVSQLSGCYRSVPDFLDTSHRIAATADAEAYLARLADFGNQIDNETARITHEYGIGVVPPDFVIDKTLEQLASAVAAPAADSGLVTSLTRRAGQANLPGDWAARATQIVERQIYPALRRQTEAVRGQRAGAVHDAGVWRLPDGGAYYEYGLRYATTTSMSADEIHQLGLDQMAELTARADEIFRAQGMTQGSVAQRLGALARDPAQVYPNTDAGKAQLLADLNVQMADMAERLPRAFGRIPRAPVEVRRVPEAIEAGSPGGYYQPPALDGSRPGAYYINLRNTAEWPKWTLPTLTYHEASPGHHHQIALAQESTAIPMLRRLMGFSAYSEGWGLYAEQLADELGVYDDDPYGRLGYIQSFMFRAARLVVDTGLHHKRWSREQAIRYMVETLGDQESTVTTEVERYCVWPGQATSYKVGQTRWLQLRENARERLGDRFDIRDFHDTALAAGGIPLAVLERVIEDWVTSRRG